MGQHLDDIIIPDVEISAGWPVSKCKTREDFDDAFAYLMAASAEIEYHLELYDNGLFRKGEPEWAANARRALKYKKAALQIINQKRSHLSEQRRRELIQHRNQVLLDHIRECVTKKQFETWLKASGALDPVELSAA